VVDRDRRFLRLVDRRALLENLAPERGPVINGSGEGGA
jgi:hypothetical protein